MHSTAVLASVLALALLGAGCASASAAGPGGPADPRSAVPPGVDPAWLHFAESAVAAGDRAPDFTLPLADGSTALSLSTFQGRPLVLVFGSFT